MLFEYEKIKNEKVSFCACQAAVSGPLFLLNKE